MANRVDDALSRQSKPKGRIRRIWDWVFSTRASKLGAGLVGVVTIAGTAFGIVDALSAHSDPSARPAVINNISNSTINQYYGMPQTPPGSGPSEPPANSDCAAQGMGAVGHGKLYVDLAAKLSSNNCWSEYLAPVVPGSRVDFLISYRNLLHAVEKNVVVRVVLPKGFQLVRNTTRVYLGSAPKGIKDTSNNLAEGGLIIGSFDSGVGAYLTFYVTVPSSIKVSCGWNDLRPMVIVQPEGVSYSYNTADLEVARQC